jgi:uncharacterized coiled-coil protein SlyX
VLRRIQADIADLKADVREIRGRAGNLETRMAHMEVRLAEIDVRIAELSVRMDLSRWNESFAASNSPNIRNEAYAGAHGLLVKGLS